MSEEFEDWSNDESVTLPQGFLDELPLPLYWRVMVMPIRPQKMSKGGIALPMESIEVQKYLNYMGRVVALGPLAGANERLGGGGNPKLSWWRSLFSIRGGEAVRSKGFPNAGDHIIYGRHAGQPMTYKGVKLLTINDDEILARVPNPDTLRVYI